jgi:hypothetical protein
MKVGSLFVSLAAKGDKDVGKALETVKSGMMSAKTAAFAMTAAIAGAIFGFERMMSFSANTGAGLKQFAQLTGMSAEALQKYQYAAREFNVSNESMESSLKGVQKTMGDMLLGKGAPEGLQYMVNLTGFDPSKAKDTMYTMQKLQEFALKMGNNPTLRNSVLSSFGVGDDVIAAMTQAAFTKERMAKANIFSNDQVSTLAKVKATMTQLGHEFEMSIGKVMVESAPQIIELFKQLSVMMKEMLPVLIEISKITASIASWTTNKLIEGIDTDKTQEEVTKSWTSGREGFSGISRTKEERQKDIEGLWEQLKPVRDFFNGMVEPTVKPMGSQPNVNIQQTNNFNNSDSPMEVGKQINNANVGLLNAQRQLNQALN